MKRNSTIMNQILLFILIMSISTGCMKMGMKRDGHMMEPMAFRSPKQVEEINVIEAIDHMIEKAVLDLSKQNFDLKSVAVWQIKSQSAGLDVEVIRQKLISKLVTLNLFKVVSRKRLNELLEEQGLSLSGTIDDKNAVDIGNLIGVEGFIDGYASVENDRFILSFTLIETGTGVIIWAKTQFYILQ